VRELERRAGLPEPATIAEAEEPMPPADLPLIVEASLFMRLSGPKQRLYTFMGTMHRLTEAVAKTVVMQQLPNVRRFYIMEEGQESRCSTDGTSSIKSTTTSCASRRR
jgi:hypothetical protein